MHHKETVTAGEHSDESDPAGMADSSRGKDNTVYKQSRQLIHLNSLAMDKSITEYHGDLLRMVGDWGKGTLKKLFIKLLAIFKDEINMNDLTVVGKLN